MTAIEYLKAQNRMTKKCGIDCDKCPLSSRNNEADCACLELEQDYPEKAVEIVEKWAKEHPIKTRQSEFLKLFPDAKIDEDGLLIWCPKAFESEASFHCLCRICKECRKKYWSEEIE